MIDLKAVNTKEWLNMGLRSQIYSLNSKILFLEWSDSEMFLKD